MSQKKIVCQEPPLRILVFSASLRKASLNKKLISLAAKIIEKTGAKVDFANMSEFDCPSLHQDLEVDNFLPKGAEEFRKRLLANDAFIISSPEYNGSMPGLLKNTIDWVSRCKPQPFQEKHALLMSASPSLGGGNQGLWSLRVPLEKLGANVYSSMFSLASALKAFNSEGNIVNESLSIQFEQNILAFIHMVESTKNYPCMKKAWLESLSE